MHIDGETQVATPADGDALTHHRFRFYPGVWSTFDTIEACTKPKFCMGCEYKHERCTSNGRVPAESIK